jgi:hypothetical protein
VQEMTRLCRLLALAALALAPLAARAEVYRMDLLVFLDKSGGAELGRRPEPAAPRGAIELTNTAALKAAGIEILPVEQFALAEQWERLRNSKNYQPLIRLAWTQKDPPAERGPALRVRFGQGLGVESAGGLAEASVSPVEGSVALLLGHYLQLDADLQYTAPAGGTLAAWRLAERRRMRRNELHHLDGPRLGILAQVSKVEAGR